MKLVRNALGIVLFIGLALRLTSTVIDSALPIVAALFVTSCLAVLALR
jgi:hypothetical protein